MMLYIKTSKVSTRNILEVINEFSKLADVRLGYTDICCSFTQ